MAEEFNTWLREKIKSLELDEEVYLEYIQGIVLEDGSTIEEIKETLSEVLGGVLVSGLFYILYLYFVFYSIVQQSQLTVE